MPGFFRKELVGSPIKARHTAALPRLPVGKSAYINTPLMNKEPGNTPKTNLSRRSFLQRGGAALGGVALASAITPSRFAFAAPTDELKLAIIGCGGRGAGAITQALNTKNLGPVKLVAMADVFEDRLQSTYNNLMNTHKDQVKVEKDAMFLGFDGYKKAIAAADVVILTTPPGFRPMMFEEAVNQGKHVFMEKPVATDAPGIRRVLDAAKKAKEKNLKVGVGLQRHHDAGYIETIKRLQDGAVGEIVSMRAFWNGNPPWVRKREELELKYGRKLTEMEYQMNNWYYFNWICGDHICEQHIHNLDVINWVKKGFPVSAHGMGGCEVRKGKDYGEIFDHHAVEFEYEDGSRCFSQCRHINGCWNSVSEHVQGTNGRSDINRYVISPKNGEAWRFKGESKDPYQVEHDDLFAAIRGNKEFNEAEYGAMSTMTSILGRMATYGGKEIKMADALNSQIDLMPEKLAWDSPMKVIPGPDGIYPHAIPGVTVVV